MADYSPDEVWPPPIWHRPPAPPEVQPLSPWVVWLITGYDILIGLLLLTDTVIVIHWTQQDRNGLLNFSSIAFQDMVLGVPLALFFFTVACFVPRLLLNGRSHTRRIVANLQKSLAWMLFWMTALSVALPTLFVAHHPGEVLMLAATSAHALLVVAGFAVAACLRRASEPAS